MSINKVTLIGRLTKDPEIRSLNNGKQVASFTLATSDKWRDKNSGERREKSEFHRVVIFNEGLVGVVKSYVNKGSKLYIEGALQTRKWQDKSGNDKYSTEIVLQGFNSTLQLLDKREDGGGYQEKQERYQPKQSASFEGLDDEISSFDQEIPF